MQRGYDQSQNKQILMCVIWEYKSIISRKLNKWLSYKYKIYTCENEESNKIAKLIPKIFEELDIHKHFLKNQKKERKKGNWEEVGEGEKDEGKWRRKGEREARRGGGREEGRKEDCWVKLKLLVCYRAKAINFEVTFLIRHKYIINMFWGQIK